MPAPFSSATQGGVEAWVAAIAGGERRALAKAVTLVESGRAADRAPARALMSALRREAGALDALRLGLSGPPGVGKSSFIESFGMMLIAAGVRIAVLAVDPSSARVGGSILGDKTRMPRLARAPGAYIRPSPSGGALGGVARRTRELITLMEAARFDVVIVETVGVGQSETMVADMTDVFALLVSPGGGDELQGVKRGVMELADLVLVNKADGALQPVANATASDYASALRLLGNRGGDGAAEAAAVSALTGAGLADAWKRIQALDARRRESGERAERRRAQLARAFRAELEAGLLAAFEADTAAASEAAAAEALVRSGARAADEAAEAVVTAFLERRFPGQGRPPGG